MQAKIYKQKFEGENVKAKYTSKIYKQNIHKANIQAKYTSKTNQVDAQAKVRKKHT